MEMQRYQDFLDSSMPTTPSELEERGNHLAILISRSGELYATCRREYMAAKKNEIFKTLQDAGEDLGAPKTAINEIIKSVCKDEEYKMNWAYSINSTAKRQLDWVRSLLSYHRAEMNMGKYGGGM